MLARKAVVGHVKRDVLLGVQAKKAKVSVVFDISPLMRQIIQRYSNSLLVFDDHDGYERIYYKIRL